MGSPAGARKRVAADEEVLSPSKHGRFSVAAGSAYCHDPSADPSAADDHRVACAPIVFAEVAALVTTTISEDAAQAMLDMTCAKVVDECEMLERITVQVDSLVPTSTGGFALLGSTAHNRFEDADAAEVKFARNTMNASIRGHPMYRNIFKHLFNTMPKVSQKGMNILDGISMEVTMKERAKADKQLKAPIFAIKPTAKKIEPTATYHEGFVLSGAAALEGPVTHMRASIDRGLLSANCTRTILKAKALQSNSFLRVFIECPHKVVMNK